MIGLVLITSPVHEVGIRPDSGLHDCARGFLPMGNHGCRSRGAVLPGGARGAHYAVATFDLARRAGCRRAHCGDPAGRKGRAAEFGRCPARGVQRPGLVRVTGQRCLLAATGSDQARSGRGGGRGGGDPERHLRQGGAGRSRPFDRCERPGGRWRDRDPGRVHPRALRGSPT